MKIPFVKMQALGNDFILLDCLKQVHQIHPEFVRIMCDRRKGIGADQMLHLSPSKAADYKMRVYNADGGEVEMCGNGIRCLARYLVARGLAGTGELRIETRAGIIKPRVDGALVTVDMGRPELEGQKIPVRLNGIVVDREVNIGGSVQRITCVSMGNPHCVIFVDELDRFPVVQIGPMFERDHLFPQRVNVEFVRVISRDRIAMRVWERGTGETMACGTGACAAVVASCLNKKTDPEVTVGLPGGELRVNWADDDHVFMSGPADEVFHGEIDVEHGPK
ncbi:MAG: diaminopimelate epimerase [Candidatus Aureabacteria bacterium]|nr:diaminopimelate epimerase [Candidatus Auribacterota bacterium]